MGEKVAKPNGKITMTAEGGRIPWRFRWARWRGAGGGGGSRKVAGGGVGEGGRRGDAKPKGVRVPARSNSGAPI